MKKRIYTDDEIKKLKSCLFVREIKRKCEIDYDPVFKLWTIMMRYEFPELTAREIFARAVNSGNSYLIIIVQSLNTGS